MGSDNLCAISGNTRLDNQYHFTLHFCLKASDFLINGKEEDIQFWLRFGEEEEGGGKGEDEEVEDGEVGEDDEDGVCYEEEGSEGRGEDAESDREAVGEVEAEHQAQETSDHCSGSLEDGDVGVGCQGDEDEDVQASNDYVLLASCETNGKGEVTSVHCDWETPSPSICTESNVTTIFNVIHTDFEGFYTNANDASAEYTVFATGSTFLVTITSYAILRTACPEVEPHILYQLLVNDSETAEASGTINDVDYGVVALTHGQYCDMTQVCGVEDYQESTYWWAELLSSKSRTEEDILREAWRGQGNLWAFVRPDRFPISDALSAQQLMNFEDKSNTIAGSFNPCLLPSITLLPLDVFTIICEYLPVKSLMSLLSVTRIIRAQILPHAAQISYNAMILHEPFYFPAQSIETGSAQRDCEERQWWEDQWAKGGIDTHDLRYKAPWMQYRVACSRSMSMWNRKRIWRVSKQIGQLARAKGLIHS